MATMIFVMQKVKKTGEEPNLHDGVQPRILKTIGKFISKLPLQLSFKAPSEVPPQALGSQNSPYNPFSLANSVREPFPPSHIPPRLPMYPSRPSVSGLYSSNHPIAGTQHTPYLPTHHLLPTGSHFRPLRQSIFTKAGVSHIKPPPSAAGGIPPNSFLSTVLPGVLPLLDLSSYSSLKGLNKRKGYPPLTDLHDNPYLTPYLPDGGPNACKFVSCRELSYYCPHYTFTERKRTRQRRKRSSSFSSVDLPFSCGLHEVCCGVDRFESAYSHPGESLLPAPSSTGRRDCGRSAVDSVKGRITAGTTSKGEAQFGEFPWQSAILKKEGNDNVYICAGSLVDRSHVLTAAHCIDGYSASQLRVRLGEWDVNRDTEYYPHVEYDVVGVAIHPDFYSGNLMNDLAIVRMLYPVDYIKMPHIGPVCLPSPGFSFAGSRCWVSGWGKDAFGKSGKYQNLLKKIDVPVVPRRTCEDILRETRLGPDYSLHPGMMCAGGEPKRDACKGDGGGPLSCRDIDGYHVLSGIVSWGIGCGQPGVPGIYVNIEYYVGWIRQMMES